MPRDLKDLMQRTALVPDRGPDIGAIQQRGRRLKLRERAAAGAAIALAGAGIWGVMGGLPAPDEPRPVQPAPQEFPTKMQPKDYAAAVAIEAVERAGLRNPLNTYLDYENLVGGGPLRGPKGSPFRTWRATFRKVADGCPDLGQDVAPALKLCIGIPEIVHVRVLEYEKYLTVHSISGLSYLDSGYTTRRYPRKDIEIGWRLGDSRLTNARGRPIRGTRDENKNPNSGFDDDTLNLTFSFNWVGPLYPEPQRQLCTLRGYARNVRFTFFYPTTEEQRDGDGPIGAPLVGSPTGRTRLDCGDIDP